MSAQQTDADGRTTADPVGEAVRATAAAAAVAHDAATTVAQAAMVIVEPVIPARRAGAIYATLNAVAALLLLLVLAPVMLAVAIAVKLDGGPVLSRQTRVGKDGIDFAMLKFRSMTDDSRVARVGRVMRSFSLDELPQLFNVVGGTMALVGPRPALRAEVERYCPLAQQRLRVRPGLTGLWHASGRSDLSGDESIRLDADYVHHWSPVLDLQILARAIGTVLRGSGAS